MKIGHLRKLLKDYPDDTELLVELVIPTDTRDPGLRTDMWQAHGPETGTTYVRGETVTHEWTHCGGGGNDVFRPANAIIEITFDKFDVTVRRKPE